MESKNTHHVPPDTGARAHTRMNGGEFAFVDLRQFPHDSNLTMNVLLHVLRRTYTGAKVQYVQLDNCLRENKNKYLCAYFIEMKTFRKVGFQRIH